MKRLLLVALALAALTPASAGAADRVLLTVNDGDFFYDTNKDCVGDTDTAQGAQALRHWHVGVPFAGAEAEPLGGFGCLGAPKTWTVTVPEGVTAAGSGSIRYTWDTNVPGGCCNDVHVHVRDAAGRLVYSTLQADGPQPVIPQVAQPRTHAVDFVLGTGTYTIVEDVFSGEHSAWLTKLRVEQRDASVY